MRQRNCTYSPLQDTAAASWTELSVQLVASTIVRDMLLGLTSSDREALARNLCS